MLLKHFLRPKASRSKASRSNANLSNASLSTASHSQGEKVRLPKFAEVEETVRSGEGLQRCVCVVVTTGSRCRNVLSSRQTKTATDLLKKERSDLSAEDLAEIIENLLCRNFHQISHQQERLQLLWQAEFPELDLNVGPNSRRRETETAQTSSILIQRQNQDLNPRRQDHVTSRPDAQSSNSYAPQDRRQGQHSARGQASRLEGLGPLDNSESRTTFRRMDPQSSEPPIFELQSSPAYELDSRQLIDECFRETRRDYSLVSSETGTFQNQAPTHSHDEPFNSDIQPQLLLHNARLLSQQTTSALAPVRRISVPLCWILTFLASLIVAGSLTVGLYFSIAKKQMGDGFTAAGYIVTVGTLILAAPIAKHYPHCKCWRREGREIVGTP